MFGLYDVAKHSNVCHNSKCTLSFVICANIPNHKVIIWKYLVRNDTWEKHPDDKKLISCTFDLEK